MNSQCHISTFYDLVLGVIPRLINFANNTLTYNFRSMTLIPPYSYCHIFVIYFTFVHITPKVISLERKNLEMTQIILINLLDRKDLDMRYHIDPMIIWLNTSF